MFSCAWSSLVHLLNLDDGFLLRVDGKADTVSGLHPLKERRGLNAIAHRHGVHKAFDLFMVHNNLVTPRYHRDDCPLTYDNLLALLCCRARTLLRLRHGDARLRRWAVR